MASSRSSAGVRSSLRYVPSMTSGMAPIGPPARCSRERARQFVGPLKIVHHEERGPDSRVDRHGLHERAEQAIARGGLGKRARGPHARPDRAHRRSPARRRRAAVRDRRAPAPPCRIRARRRSPRCAGAAAASEPAAAASARRCWSPPPDSSPPRARQSRAPPASSPPRSRRPAASSGRGRRPARGWVCRCRRGWTRVPPAEGGRDTCACAAGRCPTPARRSSNAAAPRPRRWRDQPDRPDAWRATGGRADPVRAARHRQTSTALAPTREGAG